MKNIDKLTKVFSSVLRIPAEQCSDQLNYGKDWDSVAHMALIAGLEDEFGIMIDTVDVIDMSSFLKAKIILEKYGVTFNP